MEIGKVVLAVILFVGCETFAEDAPVVETKLGKVQGFKMTSRSGRKFNAYLGIPYAKPPVGALRFKSPEPADKWEGVLDAKGMATCIQDRGGRGTEDCLQIGVYTHKVNGSLPVLVNIHGGAFMGGGFGMMGPQFLMDEDIVIAGMNYRVGILGFLSFENSDLPGNRGMKDQVLALKWIKENIQYFGGNPNDITIIGESAGGAAVYHHLISPMSKGLFHKAMVESGTSYGVWALPPKGVAKSFAMRVAADLNCPNKSKDAVPCLNALNASAFTTVKFTPQDILCPVFEEAGEDAFLTAPLNKLEHHPVPLIMGMCSAEGLMFSLSYLSSSDLFNEFAANFSRQPGHYLQYYKSSLRITKLDKYVLDYYGLRHNLTIKNWRNITQALSDAVFTVGILDGIMNHTGPVYSYYFDYPGKHDVPNWVGDVDIWFGLKSKMSKYHFREIYFYEFKLWRSAAQTTRNINEVWGQGAINECTVQRWFQKFRSGDFDLEDKEGRGHHFALDNDQLRSIVEEDPGKGAIHTAESPYIWNRHGVLTDEELNLSKNLVKMVTNFVKYGNPTPSNTTNPIIWEQWTPSNQSFLYVDPNANLGIRRSVHSETYRFWTSIDYRDLYDTSGSQTLHQFLLLPSLSFLIFIVQYLY